jgi:hypothetical protein
MPVVPELKNPKGRYKRPDLGMVFSCTLCLNACMICRVYKFCYSCIPGMPRETDNKPFEGTPVRLAKVPQVSISFSIRKKSSRMTEVILERTKVNKLQ